MHLDWITFVTLDALALVIQLIGGAIASSHNTNNATNGGNVMLAGTVILLGM